MDTGMGTDMDTPRLTTTHAQASTSRSKKLSLAGCFYRTLLYNVCMSNLQLEPTYSRMWREQHDLRFELFLKTEWDTPVKVAIRRNSYDSQSCGVVDIWTEASGWTRVLSVGLDVLEGVKKVGYLSLPDNETKIDYEEKYNSAFVIFYEDAKQIAKVALHIVRPHDTIKV
jgi:hypothetical protein